VQLSTDGEWTNQISTLGNQYSGIALLASGQLSVGSAQLPFHFRCVTPLLS
jgi:hypothetical protein